MAWGITVAPSMLAASRTVGVPSNRGTIPATASSHDTGPKNRPVTKPAVTIASRPVTTNSKNRGPRRVCRTSSSIEITPTITPPASSGIPKRMCRAIAPPITSARSVAAATSSAWTQ